MKTKQYMENKNLYTFKFHLAFLQQQTVLSSLFCYIRNRVFDQNCQIHHHGTNNIIR